MKTIDQKLYELFPTEDITLTDEFTWSQMTFKREPELHDVFNLAEEKWMLEWYYTEIDFDTNTISLLDDYFEYDATLPLLKQSDETKQDIINLFT
jgi:hypothetical protein